MSATIAAKFIDRKDIARMLELSVRQIAIQEKNLGIAPARVNLHTRCVRYHAGPALAALKARNMLPIVDEPEPRPDPHPIHPATQFKSLVANPSAKFRPGQSPKP